jgi:hypothetical protein
MILILSLSPEQKKMIQKLEVKIICCDFEYYKIGTLLK